MRKISELDYGTGIFEKVALEGFTQRQLSLLVKRHADRAFHADFWSFQVASAAAAKRVFG